VFCALLRVSPGLTTSTYTTLFRPRSRPDVGTGAPWGVRRRRLVEGGRLRCAARRRSPRRGASDGQPVRLLPHDRSPAPWAPGLRSEEHTSELQSRETLVCRPLLVQ